LCWRWYFCCVWTYHFALSHGGAPIAFAIAGLIALVTVYSYVKHRELPKSFEHKIKKWYEGTIIVALLSIIFTISFDLESISIAGSAGFLIIFSLVNLANFLLYKETRANRLISGFGFLLSIAAIIVLLGYNIIHNPHSLISSGVVISVVAVFTYIYYNIEKKETLSKYKNN